MYRRYTLNIPKFRSRTIPIFPKPNPLVPTASLCGGRDKVCELLNRVVFKSESVDHATPAEVYRKLDEEFGFTFDPTPLNGADSGDVLSTNFKLWTGQRVFCNPPYGPEIVKWLRRWEEADLAVYLIPARTDTRWFHDICLPFAKEIRFIKGRLKFGNAVNSAPFPSMLVIFEQMTLEGQ